MKNKLYVIIFSICLVSLTIYILLDTFLISNVYSYVEKNESNISGYYTTTNNSYESDNIKITINEIRKYNTTIYIADIKISDISYLKTAFANNIYGKNITAKTSFIASSNNAILAINGDYYGVQETGYVLKNGKIYRNVSSGRDDLVIYNDGTFKIINENDYTLEELVDNGAKEILSFGPSLINNGNILINENTEVGKSMASNPRTAIGIIDDNHYVFVVSDGRTSESNGLSLYELATIMKDYGVSTLYNLDGGGSSTMYFNGEVINNPTTTGRISERSVSDIVYIG